MSKDLFGIHQFVCDGHGPFSYNIGQYSPWGLNSRPSNLSVYYLTDITFMIVYIIVIIVQIPRGDITLSIDTIIIIIDNIF